MIVFVLLPLQLMVISESFASELFSSPLLLPSSFSPQQQPHSLQDVDTLAQKDLRRGELEFPFLAMQLQTLHFGPFVVHRLSCPWAVLAPVTSLQIYKIFSEGLHSHFHLYSCKQQFLCHSKVIFLEIQAVQQ